MDALVLLRTYSSEASLPSSKWFTSNHQTPCHYYPSLPTPFLDDPVLKNLFSHSFGGGSALGCWVSGLYIIASCKRLPNPSSGPQEGLTTTCEGVDSQSTLSLVCLLNPPNTCQNKSPPASGRSDDHLCRCW